MNRHSCFDLTKMSAFENKCVTYIKKMILNIRNNLISVIFKYVYSGRIPYHRKMVFDGYLYIQDRRINTKTLLLCRAHHSVRKFRRAQFS
jgi:hypothetical protein